MNASIVILAIFFLIYGVFGLLGARNIPERYKGKPWTRQYVRLCGISDLLLGVPWAIAWLLLRNAGWSVGKETVLYLVLAVPSVVMAIAVDVHYRRLTKPAAPRGPHL